MRLHPRTFRRRGISCVEAALVLPVILALVFGFIEVGHLINSHHVLHDSARQGARAAVHLENSNAQVQDAVVASLTNSIDVAASAVTVRLSKLNLAGAEEYQVTRLDENEEGEAIRVTVTVDYAKFHPPSKFLGIYSGPLTSSAVMQRKK